MGLWKSKDAWSFNEIRPKLKLLTHFLAQDARVTGIALTGSCARGEPRIHDIDLVVFHNGSFDKKGLVCSPTAHKKGNYNTSVYSVREIFGPDLGQHIVAAHADVPVDFILVEERVLWDCVYLQTLNFLEETKDEKLIAEFYLRVFCDIPLLLFYVSKNSQLRQHLSCEPSSDFAASIHHACPYVDHRCQPKTTWIEIRGKVKNKKTA